MPDPQVTWNGTLEEAGALTDAIAHHCECEFDQSSGARTKACASHHAFAHDQRWNDHLLFARRIRDCLLREEGLSDR